MNETPTPNPELIQRQNEGTSIIIAEILARDVSINLSFPKINDYTIEVLKQRIGQDIGRNREGVMSAFKAFLDGYEEYIVHSPRKRAVGTQQRRIQELKDSFGLFQAQTSGEFPYIRPSDYRQTFNDLSTFSEQRQGPERQLSGAQLWSALKGKLLIAGIPNNFA